MNKLISFAKTFAAAEEGVTMIEYGLIAALIAVVSIVGVTLVGTELAKVWTKISNALIAA